MAIIVFGVTVCAVPTVGGGTAPMTIAVATIVRVAAGTRCPVLNKDVWPSDRTRGIVSGGRCAITIAVAGSVAGRRMPR